jgi:hypothetical protein
MKKTLAAAAVLMSISVAHAGSMGPVDTQPMFVPYLTGEASYTWMDTNGIDFSAINATTTNQGWGGRLGAGLLHPYTDKLGFTGEIGGGYYGNQKFSLATIKGGIAGNNTASIDGYDVLVGALYKMERFDVFGQMGFMVQNLRTNGYMNIAELTTGGFLKGSVNAKANQTQALPEIKVGGIYNLNTNWGLSVAYMHVFGSTPSMNVQVDATPGAGINTTANSNTQNPSLDAVMFGLRYNIA